MKVIVLVIDPQYCLWVQIVYIMVVSPSVLANINHFTFNNYYKEVKSEIFIRIKKRSITLKETNK